MRAAVAAFLGLALGIVIETGCRQAYAGLDAMPDLSGYATKSDVSAVQATVPQPAMAVPPSEMPGGTVGTPGTYRPADSRVPRITRSKTLTLDATGAAIFDWTDQGAITTPVQVALAPIYSGVGVPKCWVTAATGTAASVKCVIETISIVSVVGLNVASVSNSAPSGLQVGVIALPPS